MRNYVASGLKHLFYLRGKAGSKPGSVLSVVTEGQLSIWDACYQTPQAVLKGGTGKRSTLVPLTLLPTGVYRANSSRSCWCALTAPLHPYLQAHHLAGGMFLWHYPHGHPHWALPSKFDLSGARTFLKLLTQQTIVSWM